MRRALLILLQLGGFISGLFVPVRLQLGPEMLFIAAPFALAGFGGFLSARVATRRWSRVRHNKVWARLLVSLGVATLVAGPLFVIAMQRLTFVYPPEHDARFVRGTEYTAQSKRIRAENPGIDDAELVGGVGGTGAKSLVWTQQSLDRAQLWLTLSYALLSVCFGGLVFSIGELSGIDEPVRSLRFPANVPAALQEQRRMRRFDIFLSHKSQDKEAVKEVAIQLVRRGILPWLDEWEIRPGTVWTSALEAEIGAARAAAVFIGACGTGPWQDIETQALLYQFVKRKTPLIPVFLRTLEESQPELPPFLTIMHAVDLRVNEPNPIDQIVFGITGEHTP